MSDRKGSRPLVGNIGSLLSKSGGPKATRFDLTKCQFYGTTEVTADVANKWLSGLPEAEDISITGPITLHTFILSDGIHKLSVCDLFFMICVIKTGEVVHVQVLPRSSVAEPMEVSSPTGSAEPASGSSGPEANYQVGAQGYVVSKDAVTSTSLRGHLMASAPTMALLLQNERHTGRPKSEAAVKIHSLLKDHFVEIPTYRYEVGMPSHKWNGVMGLDARLLFTVAD